MLREGRRRCHNGEGAKSELMPLLHVYLQPELLVLNLAAPSIACCEVNIYGVFYLLLYVRVVDPQVAQTLDALRFQPAASGKIDVYTVI